MKKLLSITFIFCSLNTLAQHIETDPYGSKALSFGPEVNATINSTYKTGYGVSGKAEWPLGDEFAIDVTAGYNRFFLRDEHLTQFNQGASIFIPVKAGFTFFWDYNIYANGNFGIVKQTNYDKESSIAYDFGVGYLVPIIKHNSIDLGFRYERWGEKRLRATVLRVAYRFDW